MKMLFSSALLSFISLSAEPRGSVHDAWSDWIVEHQLGEERINAELTDNDNKEIEQDLETDIEYN